VFRAIADPTRRRILRVLRGGRRTVGEIAANFRTSRPAISKHLRVLRSAGLVTSRKAGTASICGLNPRPLRAVDAWLRDYQVLWSESLRSLRRYIEEAEAHSTALKKPNLKKKRGKGRNS
jgi:DNA-binding transcriptional ArsR family regulator